MMLNKVLIQTKYSYRQSTHTDKVQLMRKYLYSFLRLIMLMMKFIGLGNIGQINYHF